MGHEAEPAKVPVDLVVCETAIRTVFQGDKGETTRKNLAFRSGEWQIGRNRVD